MSVNALKVGDDGTVLFTNALKLPADTEIGGSAVVALGTITSASATAFAVGRQGATTPVLNVNAATATVVTGITLVGAAAAAGMAIIVTSSGTNESLTIDAKGSGTLTLNATATGNIVLGRATTTAFAITQTSASASAFSSGLAGDTNPVFRLVNNIASQATGISITGRAAAAGADITVLSSGTDENLVVNAKGAGTISLNPTGTGKILLNRQSTLKSITVPVAAAGSTVADAGQLGAANIVHITSDGATKGVKAPTAVLNDFQYVINDSATACEFYAASGGTVNGLSADASVVIPASKGIFWQATAADTIIAFDLPAKATAS